MSTSNTLYIANFTGTNLYVEVPQSDWNCCDAPTRGTHWTLPALTAGNCPFVRKDGHGCDGGQGMFRLNVNGNQADLRLDFDSNGGMQWTQAPSSNLYSAYLSKNSDGTYTLAITGLISAFVDPVVPTS